MDLRYAMRTTPATRAFTEDPLPDDVLYAILDDARFAPNGGNRQVWRVIVVRDPATKRRIADLYELGMREYAAHLQAGLVPFVASEAHTRREPAVDLAEARRTPSAVEIGYLGAAPVVLVIVVDLAALPAVDSGLDRLSISGGASVYPLAHNILLGARAAGFGGHLTSLLARQEPALRELLGIPPSYALATMIPLGRPVKELTKLRRNPVQDFAVRERFDGPAFGDPAARP